MLLKACFAFCFSAAVFLPTTLHTVQCKVVLPSMFIQLYFKQFLGFVNTYLSQNQLFIFIM